VLSAIIFTILKMLVEDSGIEPLTS
jgi:hypothetical protein